MSIRVRPAAPREAAALSALALRSKAHWGYDAEFLEACRAELTYTAEQIAGAGAPQQGGGFGVVEFGVVDAAGGTPAGFFRFSGTPPVGELDALFVDPAHIGTGLGGLLLRAALEQAATAGFTALELDADPGAAPFYRHHGARQVGESPSGSIPGRVLPRLRFRLSGAGSANPD